MPSSKVRELPINEVVSSTINALGKSVSCVRFNSRAAAVQLTGSWTGTLTFYYSLDDITWQLCPMVPLGGGAPVTSTTANGAWLASLVPQGSGLMVVATAWTSGTATVACNLA